MGFMGTIISKLISLRLGCKARISLPFQRNITSSVNKRICRRLRTNRGATMAEFGLTVSLMCLAKLGHSCTPH